MSSLTQPSQIVSHLSKIINNFIPLLKPVTSSNQPWSHRWPCSYFSHQSVMTFYYHILITINIHCVSKKTPSTIILPLLLPGWLMTPFMSLCALARPPPEHPAQEVRPLEGHLHPQLSEERRDASVWAHWHGRGRGSRWDTLIRHRGRAVFSVEHFLCCRGLVYVCVRSLALYCGSYQVWDCSRKALQQKPETFHKTNFLSEEEWSQNIWSCAGPPCVLEWPGIYYHIQHRLTLTPWPLSHFAALAPCASLKP